MKGLELLNLDLSGRAGGSFAAEDNRRSRSSQVPNSPCTQSSGRVTVLVLCSLFQSHQPHR